MTQSSLQTQCPKCETRFRVTDEQLGIAKGKVRCGNCLSVFNAIEHQVIPGAARSGTSLPSDSGKLRKEPGAAGSGDDERASDEDFLFADNPEEDAAAGPYAGSKLTFSDDELSDSFRTMDEKQSADFSEPGYETQPEEVDESWAEAILEDSHPASASASPRAEESGPERSQESSPPPPEEPTEPRSPASWKPAGNSFERHDGENTPPAGPTEAIGDPMAATMPFNDLRREPVSVAGGARGGLRTLIWGLVVVALVGVLIAQVTWFQFDRLSAIPQLRPFYEKGCEWAGCELKPLINVDAIQTRKLVVRTDPENRAQLLVDAVMINRADFEQPFPAIALTFSNLNGDVVAQSIFTPEEYLAGEAKTLDAMPQDTPVRIAIAIRDPGRDAVNYNISFRPYGP